MADIYFVSQELGIIFILGLEEIKRMYAEPIKRPPFLLAQGVEAKSFFWENPSSTASLASGLLAES